MYLTGGNIIFNKLVKNNVKNVFMYSGGAIMGLIDCFYQQNKINYYIHTHEQNLGHAAYWICSFYWKYWCMYCNFWTQTLQI